MNHQRIAPDASAEGAARGRAGHGGGADRARRRQRRGGAARDRRGAGQDPGGLGRRRQRGARRSTARRIRVLDQAEQIAQKAGDSYVTVERLLLALVISQDRRRQGARATPGSRPRRSTPRSTSCAAAAPPTPQSAEDRYDALKKFARDLTQAARDGKLDPVIGRDEEIRRTVQILARRTKNNPVLIGDPGVGKTAIAEGLALRIANGDVPDSLKDRRLMALDMGTPDRRRQISRRVRGAAEGRARRGQGRRGRRHPVHRRDAHPDRRRRKAKARWTPRTC